MPLTASGGKILDSMEDEYGNKKGKSVFYASIKKGKPGTSKWHKKKKKKPNNALREMMGYE